MSEENAVTDYSDETLLKTLRETVAKGVSDSEFRLFIEVCKSTSLSPFKREIWCIKTSSNAPVQIMTGINGFYAIANMHPMFDGIETFTEGEVKLGGGRVAPAVATAIVHRKDRKVPMRCDALWTEYGKAHGTWKQMPRVMLIKCAESLALRKSFPQELNNVSTIEEMPYMSRVVDKVQVSLTSVDTHHQSEDAVVHTIQESLFDTLTKNVLMSRTLDELELVAVQIGKQSELGEDEKFKLRGSYQQMVKSLNGDCNAD